MESEKKEYTIIDTHPLTHSGDALDFSGYYAHYGKRVVDVVLASMGLLVALPLMVILAVIIALDRESPIFGHKRVGLKGRRFKCFKFRTMRVDAAVQLTALLEKDPVAALEWKMHHKLTYDPRITFAGRWIRAASLDELPQLFNVIRGDMSLVGPRPVTETELPKYGRHLSKYLAMRPGITGIWQVHGRGDENVDYEERVEMDARYFSSINVFGDLILMLQTISVVFRLRGQ